MLRNSRNDPLGFFPLGGGSLFSAACGWAASYISRYQADSCVLPDFVVYLPLSLSLSLSPSPSLHFPLPIPLSLSLSLSVMRSCSLLPKWSSKGGGEWTSSKGGGEWCAVVTMSLQLLLHVSVGGGKEFVCRYVSRGLGLRVEGLWSRVQGLPLPARNSFAGTSLSRCCRVRMLT